MEGDRGVRRRRTGKEDREEGRKEGREGGREGGPGQAWRPGLTVPLSELSPLNFREVVAEGPTEDVGEGGGEGERAAVQVKADIHRGE
jgi:hypothetical protein